MSQRTNTKQIDTQKQNRITVLCGLLFIVSIIFGVFMFSRDIYQKRTCLEGLSFVNPRFACGSDFVIGKGEYDDLKNRLIDYIENKKDEGKVIDVGLYFRDLESGPVMGINEKIDHVPASLLKLPLALAFYSVAETQNKNVLNDEIEFKVTQSELPQVFKPEEPKLIGGAYRVEELVDYMLTESNNAATRSLFDYLVENYEPELLPDVYRNLGIIDTGADLEMTAVNAKGFGSIFRQLYNVSFLSSKHSEKILSTLAKSSFKEGLVAGLPDGIKVAHKFGERTQQNWIRHLHDCGIVYFPQNPYMLCVMTQGHDFEVLKEVIKTISKSVYEEVSSRKL